MLDERQHLLTIAEAASGSAAVAERVAVETYRSWYDLTGEERARIAVPREWLARRALSVVRSHQFGSKERAQPHAWAWDVDSGAGFAADGHEAEGWRRRDLPVPGGLNLDSVHRQTVARFIDACQDGDERLLASVLVDDVVAISDGGGYVRAAVRPVRGATYVARFVVELLSHQPGVEMGHASVNGTAGIVVSRGHCVVAVLSLAVRASSVTTVGVCVNPAKLHGWRRM